MNAAVADLPLSPVPTAEEAPLIAKAAGLRWVNDGAPGIRRVKRGRNFSYVGTDGRPITDEATLARIKSLAVPPAYEDVWICPDERGHIQATGRDARGRKQYRYHPKWREVRDETKFVRMLAFAKALPAVRARVQVDLALPGLPREKVLAAVVELLETTTIRVGNEEYAKTNKSYGLTTMRNQHAQVHGNTVKFSFKGKSGVKHAIELADKRLAKIVRACQDVPGQDLFEYVDSDGTPHPVTSADVNEYIREISGGDFTAKDFRTWVATIECAVILGHADEAPTQKDRKAHVVEAVAQVAQRLGNTPAVCKKSYIHPDVLEAYTEEGTLGVPRVSRSAKAGLSPDERFVVSFLRRRTSEGPAKRTARKLRESLKAAKSVAKH